MYLYVLSGEAPFPLAAKRRRCTIWSG